MTSSSQSRLGMLAGHLAPSKPSAGSLAPSALFQQGCAAHQSIRFARPAAPNVRFGRPASSPPSNSDLEAVGKALSVIAAGAGTLHTSWPPSPTHHADGTGVSTAAGSTAEGEETTLPRFARAVARNEPRTSPFAAPLPPLLAACGGPTPPEVVPAAAAAPSAAHAEHGGLAGPWRPEMRVFETGYGWEADVALPGVSPEEVQVELSGSSLTISGRREAAPTAAGLLPDLAALLPAVLGLPGGGAAGAPGGAGGFVLRWVLPEGSDPDSVQAVFRDGMLRIRVHKRKRIALS